RTAHAIVALHEFRTSPSSAACAVTVQTGDGIYASSGFLCWAWRSDEEVVTKNVSVTVVGWEATLRFTVDFATGEFHNRATPAAHHDIRAHVIRCRLGPGTPRCTKPPAIASYGEPCPRR